MKTVYSIIYSVELILISVLAVLLYKYYLLITIPEYLLTAFPINLSHFISIIIFAILLVLYFVITLALLIKTMFGDREVEKPLKVAAFVLPIVFVMLFPIVFFAPMAGTKVDYNSSFDPNVTQVMEKVENAEITNESISEKNALGKACYYKKNCYLESESMVENDCELDYLCVYQESDKEFIQRKFERSFYIEDFDKKIEKDNYTLYYSDDGEDGYVNYAMIIQEGNAYFTARYNSINCEYGKEYSMGEFVEDSLKLYEAWESF